MMHLRRPKYHHEYRPLPITWWKNYKEPEPLILLPQMSVSPRNSCGEKAG
jgi:hypothetical protein